jgi:hypothetical protein
VEENIPNGSDYGKKTVKTNVLIGNVNYNSSYQSGSDRNLNATPFKIKAAGAKVGIGIIGAEVGVDVNFGAGSGISTPPPATGKQPAESTRIPSTNVRVNP